MNLQLRKTEMDDNTKMIYIPKLGYDQNFDQTENFQNFTNFQEKEQVEFELKNPNLFSEGIEKLFSIIQSELDSIDCENMHSNLENILSLVKEDISRKFTTSKNLNKIEEIFKNNFEIIKDYFKRCLVHTLNVKISLIETLKNGLNELNEIHLQEIEREKLNFLNQYNSQNYSEKIFHVFDEKFIEFINNLSSIIKDYVKSTRTHIKTLKKDSEINANKYCFIKSNLTNFLSQNLQNSSFKNLFNNQNKIIKNLIEKFEEIETTRFESIKVIKQIDNGGLRFYEDAKIIFKNLKNLHNSKLKEIQNLNTEHNENSILKNSSNNNYNYYNLNQTQNDIFSSQKTNKLNTENCQIKFDNLKSKSIDPISRQEKRKSDSVSPGIKSNNIMNNLSYLSISNPQRKQINNSNIHNTSSGNSFNNTSTNLENSYSYTHSNFTNSRNHIQNKRLNRVTKSVDSFNSRNINNLNQLERATSYSNKSNATNHNIIDINSNNINYIEDHNKLLSRYEIIKTKNSELNLQLIQLHEALSDSQYENQRLKKENDMYYKHLIQAGIEVSTNLNLNNLNQKLIINVEDPSKSPIKSRTSQINESVTNFDKIVNSNLNDNMNIYRIANLVISFINHMSALQDAISKKISNVKEMKKEFELKKKELSDYANNIINNQSVFCTKKVDKVDNGDNLISSINVSQIDKGLNIERTQAVEAKNNSFTIIVPCEKCKNTIVEVENYKLQINNLNLDKEKLTSEISSLTEEKKKLNSKIVVLTKSQDDNKVIIEEISRLKVANEDLVNENKKLFSDNQQMAEEFTKLQDYFQTMEDAKIAEIKSAEEIEKKKLYIKDLEEKLKSLLEDSKSKKIQIDNLSQKVNSLTEDKNSLSEILNEDKVKIDNLLQKNSQNAEEKKNLNDQITLLNTKIKNLSESNIDLAKQKYNLELELKERGEKISNLQNENKKIKIEIDKKSEENNILSKNLESIEKQLNKEINGRIDLQTKFESCKNELTSLENKLKEYETNIIPNLKTVQGKYEKKIEQEFEMKLQQCYENLSQRESELMEIKDKYNKLQQQLNIASGSNENFNINQQIESLNLKIIESEKNSKKFMTQNENLNKEHKAICNLINNTFEKISIKFRNLQNILKEKAGSSANIQSNTLTIKIGNKFTNLSEIEENLIIDEEIEIKEDVEEEDRNIETKFANEENSNNPRNKKDESENYYNIHLRNRIPSSIIDTNYSLKDIEKTLIEFSQMLSFISDTVEEKVKQSKEFSIRESQYIEENIKLKSKFDECIQTIYDTIAISSPNLLEQFGLLDNESDSSVSDSIKKEIEIDFIQKAVDLFKLFVNEMNEENKKLKAQVEEIKIYKIRAEEYKSVLDLAILNKEENSYRKKTKDSHRNLSNFNHENSQYTLTKDNLDGNVDGNLENVYENNLTVDDLFEDKNIFLDIVKKECNQINQMSQNQSDLVNTKNQSDKLYSPISHHNEQILRLLTEKEAELIEIKSKFENLLASKQEEIMKMEVLLKEEQQRADCYKNKHDLMAKALENKASLSSPQLLKINENLDDKEKAFKNANSSSTNYNKIVIPKLHLKAINKSFNTKEDLGLVDEDDEDYYLEKLNKNNFNQYQSEKNTQKENTNFSNKNTKSNKNLNHTVGIIKKNSGIDYFEKLNESYNKDFSNADSVETDNLQDHILKLEENEQLLLEQLTTLKEELKQTRIQRDQYKKIVEDCSKLDDKTEIVKALKPMIEKLIAEIILNDKIKQILAVILKILSCSDDQIKQIFNNKEMNKKTFFSNFFGVK